MEQRTEITAQTFGPRSTGSMREPTILAVLKADEAAALLDCEVETVNARAAAGELPGLKVGRSWIFPVRALEDRLNEMALEEAAKRRAPVKPQAVSYPPPSGRRRPPPSLGSGTTTEH